MPAMPEANQDSASSPEAAVATPPPLALELARPRRNWDAYVAIVATLIGLLALVVSAYTAHVQREQLRAQVWPYVIVNSANVAPDVGLHAVNSGTGPARVIAVRVTVDHRPVKDWNGAKLVLGGEPGGFVQSQLSHTVLPAGKDLIVVRPFSAEQEQAFMAWFFNDKHDLSVAVCYCSVLDDCWLVTTEAPPEPIDGPDACPITAAEQFKQ